MTITLKETILNEYKTMNLPEDTNLIFNNSESIYRFMQGFNYSNYTNERVWVLAVNAKLKFVGIQEISIGSQTSSVADPKNIFQFLLLANANSFFLIHNHPSGDCSPSYQDIELTERIKEAGKIMNIKMNDHIILGENEYYSFTNSKKVEL